MAKNELQMTILSPTAVIYDGRILSVTFPGAAGSFAVYPSHAPIIAALKAGVIAYCTAPHAPQTVSIRSGFVEVDNNRVTVCVEEDPTGRQTAKPAET
ncbi:MAG: ATP synthase F1 subunit epsilon [Tannerella sp.]|jgi:F-type H+-transporting ATPase subunit epsilon|nr:ATP synthase F1 subunit epsilon [Tannerella sp.]